jgi:putative colanic acid biosynthesis acetyltransferase WcaF
VGGEAVNTVDLSLHRNDEFDPGRPFVVRACWVIVEALVLLNPVVTSYRIKRAALRAFGARIGRNVVVKPNVHVKYPWRLEVGDNSWLGERSWIDNFVTVRVGANCCISQGAYLCTGNHDWSDPAFRRIVEGIVVEDGAWIGAFARIAPGVTVGRGAVVALGAVLAEDAAPSGVYVGNPAVRTRTRTVPALRTAERLEVQA